ncbi:MAG TPA: hypothetical protein VFB58_18995 [Chloroflexota bacterium]|nr:hypothetical protein [Chloroflexota bacterium]
MAYYLPQPESDESTPAPAAVYETPEDLADLRIIWGPDACRLGYLIHLLDTGRIVDERLAARS